MKNIEVADIFYSIAILLEMDETSFRSRAYERAARSLESLNEDIAEIYKKGGTKELEKIPGIGKGLARAIEDYLNKGKIRDYEELKKKCPVKIDELSAIEGLGPKMIKVLYKKLDIKNLKDLERKAKTKKIRELEGFGEKSEENILQSIEFVKKDKGRFLLGDILPQVREVIKKLKTLKEVEIIDYAGSIRRMKETVGDADILVVSNKPTKVMDFFVNLPNVKKVWASGQTKSSVRFKEGFDCDLRVIKKESYGSALQYFTGNKYHNILTRKIAIKKKLKLNEYGIYRGRDKIAGQSEKEVYKAIGLPYIEPELRENKGEIEAAINNQLPKVVGYNDIRGDLHVHSTASDGHYSIEEMAKAAQKMGHQYIAITDHAKDLKIARGLDEKRLLAQIKEIDRINKKFSKFRILSGCEVNIRDDGSIDIADEVLAKLDIVVAGVHSKFKMGQKEMTNRIIKAMENPHVNIISHLTARLLLQRQEYLIDIEKILKSAKETKTALEINAHPSRLDLSDDNVKKTVEKGIKLVISTDAHHLDNLKYMELGIATARRGWAEKKDILNTLTVDKLLEYFN